MSAADRGGRAGARPRLLFVVESGTDVRMVEGLAERYELRILARRIAGGREISWPPAEPVPVDIGPASRAAFAALAARRVIASRKRLDAVLVQGYGAAALAVNLAARLVQTPSAMLICSPVEAYYRCRQRFPQPGKPYRRRHLAALSFLARLNARCGRRYLVLSHHLEGVVRGHGTRRPVDRVPIYGVDAAIFHPPVGGVESLAARRRARGLPEEGKIVFFSSRIAPEKDAETLLAAFRRLLDRGLDLWLLHRSGGYRELVARAERFGVAERVIAGDAAHPHRGLADDYRASDLCVQASREEGLGFSPLEALACAVPVVATAVGGLRETVVDGETGWSYPVGDVEALADRLEEVLECPKEAARRARVGRLRVLEDYERQRVFDRLEDLLP